MKYFFYLLIAVFAFFSIGAWAEAMGVRWESAEFAPDGEFPELLPWIIDGYDLRFGSLDKTYKDIVSLGATLRLFFRNEGSQPVQIDGILLDGINLAEHILPIHKPHSWSNAANYHLNEPAITAPEVAAQLDKLGEPVWFRARPNPVPAGAFGEAVIRFRAMPFAQTLSVRLESGKKTSQELLVPAKSTSLSIASISFNHDINRIYLYVRERSGADFNLSQIRIDGNRAEAACTGTLASCAGFLPIEIPLENSWEHGSFHHIEVGDALGRRAAAVIRARDDFFALGMWGYRTHGELNPAEQLRETCAAFREHLFNTHMGMAGPHSSLLERAEGMDVLREMSLRFLARDPNRDDMRSPILYARFLLDEPDAHEYSVDNLPDNRRLGSYAQGLVNVQRKWTAADKRTLTLLNLDETYKPQNWFMYGALPDILSIDPYYQEHLVHAYWKRPGAMSRFFSPYCLYASSDVARHACEPNPLHLILNSVCRIEGNRRFRYGTPEEKRLEFYFALAAGAKGISYWWFTPYGECKGCGSDEPGAKAMMKELKILNAEARALEPLLALSHPAEWGGAKRDPFASARPPWLMARTLFCGTHTAIIILINRNHASDKEGTNFAPIPQAPMAFQIPPWMKNIKGFRMKEASFESVPLELKDGEAAFAVADINLTGIIILTDDEALAERLLKSGRQAGQAQ